MKKIIVGVLLSAALFSITALHAATPEEAAMIANAAERGSTSSQVLLAVLYANGDGGKEKNDKLAAYWFERAAEGGNPYAQQKLGDLYEAGRGVPLNLKVAADWREKAARRGNVDAQAKLGKMYLEGRGVDKDYRQAESWLNRAAVEGSGEAQFLLGKMYHLGIGVERNREIAGNWLAKAAAHSYDDAAKLLHLLESFGLHVEEGFYQRLPDLHKLAADGDAEAQYQLAVRYESGAYGIDKEPNQALYWFRRAADSGHVMAMKSLAHIYRDGLDGVQPDREIAAAWADKARSAAK
ncbi:MAG: sel1 repeat family protein [Sulfuricella sp.]|nr:sel1 repeat family protein [Sulfuricella sp.]